MRFYWINKRLLIFYKSRPESPLWVYYLTEELKQRINSWEIDRDFTPSATLPGIYWR